MQRFQELAIAVSRLARARLRDFTVHSITWRALPVEFGNWNSIWKRFWWLSRSGVFEAFLQLLAETRIDCLAEGCRRDRMFAVSELASFYGRGRTVGEVLRRMRCSGGCGGRVVAA